MGGAQGKYHKKSTAKEVVDGFLNGASLAGKTAIVTGGNSGIGLETVKVLAAAGCRVILCSRSIENGKKAIETEVQTAGHGGYVVSDVSNIVVKQLELGDLKSIKACAEDIAASEKRIDFLILNAGIMAIPTLQRTEADFEQQVGVNHYGHFYFTSFLASQMAAQGFPSRIVVVSSMAHKFGGIRITKGVSDIHYKTSPGAYSSFGAYGQSKLANILFAKSLADRLKGSKVTTCSLHPGVIQTNLGRHMGLPVWMGAVFSDKTIPQGASTTLYGCLAPEIETSSGAYLDNCAIATPNSSGVDADGKLREALWQQTEADLKEVLGLEKPVFPSLGS